MVAAVGATAAPRGGFFSPGLAPRSPEVMLYFSHSIGAGGAARPTFGLRVNQVRQASNTGDPEAGDSMQHREWLNWQMEAHSNLHISDVRFQLGRRVTYDVTNRHFGSPNSRSAMQLGTPTLRNGSLNPTQPRPVFARTVAPPSSASEVAKDNSNVREIAVAAMAAIAPARLMAAQRQAAQRPHGGIAAVVAAQRAQSAHGGAGGAFAGLN